MQYTYSRSQPGNHRQHAKKSVTVDLSTQVLSVAYKEYKREQNLKRKKQAQRCVQNQSRQSLTVVWEKSEPKPDHLNCLKSKLKNLFCLTESKAQREER